MAAFDHVQNMYDVAVKPRLLRSFIKELIPDEKQQLGNPLELSQVVSAIKTHGLLSERVAQTDDNKKLIEKWKSAVDLWVDRLLMLVSSNMPDKCWAGICLLGVTFEECSSERFLASYSVWFQKLLSHLQPPAESHFVKVSCCVSISDLLTRLSGFPNMKKDGTSHAAKLVQPVLKLIQEDSSDAEGAVRLLCTILNFFPSSLQKNYDSAEAAIVTKLIYGKCNPNMLKKLALCLSLLPKSKGDEETWSLMIHKILIAINILLNDSFQGLEEESKTSETMRALVPPGKDPPAPLGGLTVFDLSNKSTERLSITNISSLMLCCSTMLTTSYAVRVKVPIKALLMVVERVLNVDGSLPQTMYPTLTAMQQEYICTQLPVLHSYSLEILCDIIKEARSQLLPHTAHTIRLVTEYIRRCELPELRVKLYGFIKMMLMSMGVGMTIYLAEDVISNASVDLDSTHVHGGEAQPMNKKRKHENAISFLENQSQIIYSPKNHVPISVKIAALGALETLLTVGGALRSESWRSNVDQLLITVATDACKNGWAKEANDVYTPSWGDFQLASLRALLASLLSPGRFRPAYLAQGLELFRGGMQETGTKLAEFCAHALLSLEVLIHPRALPLIDIGSSVEYPVNVNGMKDKFMKNNIYSSGVQKSNLVTVTGGTSRNEAESEEDDLYEKWVKDGENEIEKNTAENAVSIEATINVAKDKGKGILVETQSIEETDRNALKNMETEVEVAVAVAKGVSGGGAANDVAGRRFETVGGSEGGGQLVFAIGDNDNEDAAMDEIPDIVDVEPDSDEE
ncbi:uncharacterized protein LOC111916263 isoform X1 [Lactuca sativa]|uniref:Pre-rRNA-processing protein RIX1 N-terminal domain-containing protein n=2 Tax=Lactuca sativa TaxID=4236 RepID=A0A9R1WAB6_LACSA|nr:uncharacterized protein LOC111916263 isoform X1 [Lactuca sativa]KAJ0220079.1 hypothetical protein LSAT_V11C200088700 [Lactuca sativa]